jgi:2-amino-4-hydroxy-6-hydroxymethyldihydropteridine diphosphokinase
MDSAREALKVHFPDIRFSKEMETEAIGEKFLSPFSNQVASFETTLSSEEVRHILKEIERTHGRSPEDKAQGIVKLDIDLLMVDDRVLKPKDLEKDFVLEGMRQLHRL